MYYSSCMHALLTLGQNGDPGPKGVKGDMRYQGLDGVNGERGQKGNHSNRMIPLACYDVSVGDKGNSGQRSDHGDRHNNNFGKYRAILTHLCSILI